jgi:DNA-binding NarL/FixJ family response regulator
MTSRWSGPAFGCCSPANRTSNRQFTRIPPAPPRELDELTAREQDILLLIARGLSNSEIGRQLYISETTVKTHVTHILQKLGLRDRVQAVILAYQAGLFEKRADAR